MSFDLLFVPGRVFSDGSVEPRDVGLLTLTTGRIRMGDPSTDGEPVLVRTVAPGTYPVSVSVATFPDGDVRVAAARVVFAERPVAKWEPALPEGKDPKDLEPGEFFGYGVDAGLAAFADASAPWGFERYDKEVLTAIEAEPNQTCAWRTFGDLAAFTSGAGDDFYASFWGLDAAGAPVCLVTEFRIVGLDETNGEKILAEAWPGTAPPAGDLTPYFVVGSDLQGTKVARVDEVGTIDIAGRVVVGPARELLLLEREVPAGEYPVRLSIVNARLGKAEVEQVAVIGVVFSDAPIAQWEVAVPRGVDVAALPDEATAGLAFHCENGEAFFIGDDGTRSALDHAPKKASALIPEGSQRKYACAIVTVGTHRVVGLNAGVSGGYAFWAVDAADRPVMLVGLTSQIGWKATRPFDVIEQTKRRARG